MLVTPGAVVTALSVLMPAVVRSVVGALLFVETGAVEVAVESKGVVSSPRVPLLCVRVASVAEVLATSVVVVAVAFVAF